MFKKIIAFVLCMLLMTNSFPVEALNIGGYTTEKELRKAIMGDEKWLAQFPNGLLNFVGTQFEINEAQEFLEIPIVRQGGTEGKISVDFKAIDISAKYGEDYVIRIYENAAKNEVRGVKDSFALIEAMVDTEINISEGIDLDEDFQVEMPLESGDEKSSISEQSEESSLYYSDLQETEISFGEGKTEYAGSLRQAREMYLGKKSDRPNWKTLDEGTVEKLKGEYDKFLYNMPGTQATIEFDEGEYIKYIYIVPLNDNLSESQEQIMLALESPEGGASRGEFYMAYVNIIDDERPEKSRFEILTSSVTTGSSLYEGSMVTTGSSVTTSAAIIAKDVNGKDGGTVSVVVQRTGGLQSYDSVIIGTEEGSAISGVDYEPGIGELFFVPGMSQQKVSVNILYNPERKTDRQFSIALDFSNKNVKTDAATIIITIPAIKSFEEASEMEETNLMLKLQLDDYYDKDWCINAEKPTEFGYPLAEGKWVITADDFLKNGELFFKNDILPFAIGTNGIGYNYTVNSAINRSQGVNLKFDSLGGVDRVSFYYKNQGTDKLIAGYLDLKYLKGTSYQRDLENSCEIKGNVKFSQYVETGKLKDKRWFGLSGISLWTYAPNLKTTNNPNYFNITLNMKKYNTNIIEADKIVRKKYEIKGGKITEGSKYKEYSPGNLYVKDVYSYVYNYQKFPANPSVYRSDRIEFGYQYSEDNPNGKYAKYIGFEIKNGKNWIYFEGTDLILNAKFFNKAGIYEAIKEGKIEIRPKFSKIPAKVSIHYDDIDNGWLKNATTKATDSKSYMIFSNNSKLNKDEVFAEIYAGDVIVSLEAEVNYAAKPPVWISHGGNDYFEITPNYMTLEGIIVTETHGGTKIDYILENPNNQLDLKFKEGAIIVAAQPNIYKHSVSNPSYRLDGVSYNREAFLEEMGRVYEEVDGKMPANSNPSLEIEFNYLFNTNFPDPGGLEKKKFGEPKTAYLNIYKNNGVLRNCYEIDYIDSRFKFTGKPKELGWGHDDVAGIYIEGSGMSGAVHSRTPEIIVDFLSNSSDGIVVTLPGNKENPDILGGKIDTPVTINSANPLENYKMQAFTSTNYIARWMDFSLDLNNDGQISYEERKNIELRLSALGYSLSNAWDDNIYWGNYYTYNPRFFNPSKIYYSFEKLPMGMAQWNVEVNLFERYKTILNPDILSDRIPIKDAEVYIAGKKVSDSASDDEPDGIYKDSDPLYQLGNYYQGQLVYRGEVYPFSVMGGSANEREINPGDLMFPYDFKAVITTGSKAEDQNLNKINNGVWIRNADTTFTYRINGEKAGMKATDSLVRIYRENGTLFSEKRTGMPVNDEFTYKINSSKEGVKPGYTTTIAGLITNSEGDILHEYPETRVGMVFTKELSLLSVLASFQTMNKPTVSMLGKLNNNYDLGMNVNLLKSQIETYTDKNGKLRKIKTIAFGFNDEDIEKLKNNSKDTEEDQKGNDEVLEEETKNKDKEKLIKTVEEASKGADKSPEKKSSGGGDFNMSYEISLLLTLELGQNQENDLYSDDGLHYFSSLVLMAKGKASYEKSNTFITPIGIPVKVTLSAGGTAAAAIAFEADHTDPYNQKYKLDGEGNISINPKNYDVYATFIITPTVTLSAGAGAGGINLEISGTADFDFKFTAPIVGTAKASSGSGGMEISSKLKLKILFIQKSWTLYKGERIEFFSYGRGYQNIMNTVLNNPYRDYLYETMGELSDEDIMPRNYLENRNGWNNLDDEGLPQGVHTGNENVLQIGAFPDAQTKLIPIDENKMLLLFIEDDISRDVRNRGVLMYSIINGEHATVPVAIDSDGTWDQAPDAFLVDNKILVTWSNGGRKFTKGDNQIDILSAMNISGAWFDLESESFGEAFAVTKTVELGDNCGDTSPKISYDSNMKRLMIYYVKTDYTDKWDVDYLLSDINEVPLIQTPESLYGDIINGYSVMAYRYADYDEDKKEFVWNEDDSNADQYYGQKFLDLAPVGKIEETEHEIEDETIIVGDGEFAESFTLTHTGTTQIIKEYDGLSDPRVLETALTTDDSLAIFAYILDKDSDLKTTDDQQLYVQTYNYNDKTFSHPVEITNSHTQNKQPQFIHVDDSIYLYWLQEGKIVYTCISECLKKENLKKVTVPDKRTEFYIIDKTNTTKTAHINTAIEHDNLIDEFKIMSKNNSIYVMWTEPCISYKDGLNAGDEGTDNPANINQEQQVFAACTIISDEGERLAWSAPVQVTKDEGKSFSDLSFVITGENSFTMAYLRYTQEYNSEEGYFSNSDSVNTLAVNDYHITSDPEFVEIIIGDELLEAGETVTVSATLINTGLAPFEKYVVGFYVIQDGETIITAENLPENSLRILGGSSGKVYGSFVMPQKLNDIDEMKIGFVVKDENGNILETKEERVNIKPELEIKVAECQLLSHDRAKVKIYVQNTGNMNFKDRFTMEWEGKTLYEEMIEVDAKENCFVIFEADISSANFSELKKDEEGGRFDILPVNFKFGEFSANGEIQRRVSAQKYKELSSIEDFSMTMEGRRIPNRGIISIGYNDIFSLETEIVKDGKAYVEGVIPGQLEMVWSSSNSAVVSILPNGLLVPISKGTATITSSLRPVSEDSFSYTNGTFAVENTPYKLPEGLKKEISITVNVGKSGKNSSDSEKDKPEQEYAGESVSGSVQGKETIDGNTLIITLEEKEFQKAIKNVNENLIIKSDSANDIKNIELSLTANSLKAIADSGIKYLSVDSIIGGISFDRKALDGIIEESPNNQVSVLLSVNRGEIQVSIRTDSGSIKNLHGGAMIVSAVYTLDKDEDPNGIVVYRTEENRENILVKLSSYFSEIEKIVLKVDSPGKFNIGYNKKRFRDDLGWAKNYITFLSSRNIVLGTADGIFNKDKTVTRAEFVTMLSRLTDDIYVNDDQFDFVDVPSGEWYEEPIKWAFENGIVRGTGENVFSPLKPISREEMAVILHRYIMHAELSLLGGESENFNDGDYISNWGKEAVKAMKDWDIMVGTGDNKFEPTKLSSRAEAAKVLTQILNLYLVNP